MGTGWVLEGEGNVREKLARTTAWKSELQAAEWGSERMLSTRD